MKQQLTYKRPAQQGSAVLEGSQRRNTKHESAWPFRIWYNFDHKYPLSHGSNLCDPALRSLDGRFQLWTPGGALSVRYRSQLMRCMMCLDL